MQEEEIEKSEISDRISEIIDSEGIDKKEFGKRLGYTQFQSITDYTSGKVKPGFDFFERFAKSEFSDRYDLMWLIAGTGPKTINSTLPIELNKETVPNLVSKTVSKSKSKRLDTKLGLIHGGEVREVYLLDVRAAAATFQAGYFGPDNPATLSTLQIPSSMLERSRMHYAIPIVDHSMKPTIYNGDIVICFQVQPEEIRDNHIYVVSERNKGLLVKRLLNRLSERGTIRARSDNPDEAPFEILENDIVAVFQVKFKISFYLPNENEGIQNSILELKERIETIEIKIKQ